MNKAVFFFIGTEAELIKVFPIMVECKNRELLYKVIASGQNDICNSRIVQEIDSCKVDLTLSSEKSIKKSAVGLARWWLKTYSSAAKAVRGKFTDIDFTKSVMIVHGDTVSTYMGAKIGKKLGMTVCHVEAGLRSHNLWNPFPEEIDRMLTSRIARVHFAPGDEPMKNLAGAKGKVINTHQNTLVDSLRYANAIPLNRNMSDLLVGDYFVFVMHRQENLANKKLFRDIVRHIEQIATRYKCIFILHEITKNALKDNGMLEQLRYNKNFVLLPRVDYFDFMKLLQGARFVITDGGSNQEELYYMGKPTLIIRRNTERNEGLGLNARLYNGNVSEIDCFADDYKELKCGGLGEKNQPTQLIVDELENMHLFHLI